jgi:hypothetical protein
MILALLKLILGGVLLFSAIQLLSNKEASTMQKGLGVGMGIFAAILLLPMLLTFTFYAIGVILLVIVGYLIVKTLA